MPPIPVSTTNDKKINAHAEPECDRALLVRIGLQRADVDPLERERQQGQR